MTSNINPQNIDGAYPVAGQDNDSQGFRDNFTNTRTNFQFAKEEITDLQNNVILKSALTGTTLNNNMNGSVLSNAQLQNMRETVVNLGTVSGAITLVYATASYFTLTTGGSVVIVTTGWPTVISTPVVGRLRFRVTVASIAHTVTIAPTGVLPGALISSNNIQGMDPATGTITFNQTGTYEYELESSNGGASISVFDLNRNRDPLYLPSVETFNANGDINLNVTNSIVTSNADITGNLFVTSIAPAIGNAASGQIKTLIYGNATVGNCLVNVVDAGWKASGNGVANLSAVGSAATFQYINGKWYCIGNNGVVFT